MFQSFTTTARPDLGPARLATLRAALAAEGLDGCLVPRADAHQGEYVAAHDERLSWLTGFTGSAGFAIVLPKIAGVFIDGRYRVQVRQQCDLSVYTPVPWPETSAADWLKDQCTGAVQIGFDPWLHAVAEIDSLRQALAGTEITLVEIVNPVDQVWEDQPAPPMGAVSLYPAELAGATAAQKCADLAAGLRAKGEDAAVITLPDSLCWLLNIRGSDIPRVPVAHGFGILHGDGSVDLFMAEAKLAAVREALPRAVRRHDPALFAPALGLLKGKIRLDKSSVPVAVHGALQGGEAEIVFDRDPCVLPKACKVEAELAAAAKAHRRDGAAMVEFLAWLDGAVTAGETLTEIDVVKQLESCRTATNQLKDISFDTICGAGPNGAIVHYRVTEATNRTLATGELLLVDSGGQYLDGTTDITRTMAIGTPGAEERACYTRVLRGLIAMSQARFPKGVTGRELDVLARMPLWQAGQDYGHGTGHGVGQYLSVHEGPQRLSRAAAEPLLPGMILSNEPGYYREGAFGIRIENLIVVTADAAKPGDDPGREMRSFETLTYVPFDRWLIEVAALSPSERAWIDAYHLETRTRLAPLVSAKARGWLEAVTAPL